MKTPTPSTASWLWQLTQRLLRATPYRSSQAIIASLVSQSALMVAMLLPIKVVMLMGLKEVPDYMPELVLAWPMDRLVIALGLLTVLFFVVFLIAEKLSNHLVDSAALKIIKQSGKIILFENQDQIAKNTYSKVVTAIADILFFIIVCTLLLGIYPLVSCLALVFVALVLPLLPHFYTKSKELNQPKVFSQRLHTLNNSWFFVIFSAIVVQHLYFLAPSVLFTILAIILVRQATARLVSSTNALADTVRLKNKISALFFQEHKLLAEAPVQTKSIQRLIAKEQRKIWIAEVLQEALQQGTLQKESLQQGALKKDPTDFSEDWLQTGIAGNYAFRVSIPHEDDTYIVKIYDKNKRSLAIHEASLLSSNISEDLPAPRLIYFGDLQGFSVILLQHSQALAALENKTKTLPATQSFHAILAGISVPDDVSGSYLLSHPLLWQRLDLQLLDALRTVITAEQEILLDTLCDKLAFICRQLKRLPLSLMTPSANYHTLLLTESQSPIVWSWGQWRLDLYGSTYFSNGLGVEKLLAGFEAHQSIRPDLEHIPKPLAALAFHTMGLERNIRNHQHLDAAVRLPAIIECVSQLEQLDPHL